MEQHSQEFKDGYKSALSDVENIMNTIMGADDTSIESFVNVYNSLVSLVYNINHDPDGEQRIVVEKGNSITLRIDVE